MKKFKEALEAEKNKDYERSIQIYQQLKTQIGTSSFDYNIDRARRLLNKKSKYANAKYFLEEAGVECIYMINLASKPGKRLKAIRELKRVGIDDICYINGIEGWIDDDAREALYEYQKRKPGRLKSSLHIANETQMVMKKNASFGTFGYLLTQKKIFQDALKNNYRRICVFDDDVIFIDNYEMSLSGAKSLLLDNWAVIHLGASEYSEVHPIDKGVDFGSYLAIPHKTCGSFATLYDKSVFSEIIEAAGEMDGPFDNVTLGSIYKRFIGQCHIIYPNACAADVHSSSIRNPRDQFSHSKNMRWHLSHDRYYSYRKPHIVNIIARDPEVLHQIFTDKSKKISDVTVNCYYLSDDGPRPLHSHNSCLYPEDIERYRECFDEAYFKNSYLGCLEDAALAPCDLTVLWPSSITPNHDIITSIVLDRLYAKVNDSASLPPVKVVSQKNLAHTEAGLASVIIPMARSFSHVIKTIDSVIVQDYDPIEIILVIDSPSKSIDVEFIRKEITQRIHDYGCGRRRDLKLIQHKRVRYGCGARNTGIIASKGEFISFLDDDDLYTKSRLSLTIGHLTRPENAAISACYCSYSGLWSKEEGHEDHRFQTEGLAESVLSLQYMSHFIHTGTVTYRRNALLSTLGFDEKYERHQDIELNARFLNRHRIGYEKYVGMLFKPQRHLIKPTTILNFHSMLKIKKYLIEDFSQILRDWTDNDQQIFFSNHAKDFSKLIPVNENKLIEIIEPVLRSFLFHK